MNSENDDKLIRKFLSGDDSAFKILVERYQDSIHTLAWRKIQDYHYAEEIMQDTFLKAYNKLPSLKNHTQFAGWIHVIADRLCTDWVRKYKPEIQSLDVTDNDEIELSSFKHHMTEQREIERNEYCQKLVNKLLEKLPEKERNVLILYYLDDMSTKEISETIGVSVNTITSRLQRARKRLQSDNEIINQEFLDYFPLSEKLKENIMSQLDQIQSKFDSYMEQVKTNPTSRDDLLTETFNEIEDTLKGDITPEVVHLLVDDIYPRMGKQGIEKQISLLNNFLNDASDNKERFWAHQELASSLAILGRHRESVEEQLQLYHWACKNEIPDKDILHIFCSNLENPGAWSAVDRNDEWIQLYHEASERLKKPEVSYFNKCEFLQIGAEVLRGNGKLDDALIELEKLEKTNAKQDWRHYFRFWLIVKTNRLLIYHRRNNMERFEEIITELKDYMEVEYKKYNAGQPVSIGDLIWLSHDIGCSLVWINKYSIARSFLQVACDLGGENHYGHFMLAVSIWATDKDREKTLHHLKIAENDYAITSYNFRDSYYSSFVNTDEFSDVKDDPEFLKVFGQ
ncbi:RNA polymerase sigma factor [Candidatus Poribacteria bacterium]|nr:RNA polymerase sigma factor [Candidatus Poribacteria bacterium]